MVYISNFLPGFVQQVYFVSFSQTGEIHSLYSNPSLIPHFLPTL